MPLNTPPTEQPYRQPAGVQDSIDWGVFAAKFVLLHGSLPVRGEPTSEEAFHWFTVGAHAEFMGRLNPKPNTQDAP